MVFAIHLDVSCSGGSAIDEITLGKSILMIDKSRANIAGRRFYSSTPQSRYYHVRNYWKVMRYLRDTGAGSWRMYLTYFYEVFKAMAITLVVEWNFKGTTLVLKGVMDGMHGRWGKLR